MDLTVIVDDSGLDSFWEGLERWFHSVGRVNAQLTPAQQMAVESLPPIQANEVSVIGVHLAVASLYRIEACALADEIGAEWPNELEEADLGYLRARTGSDFASS